MLRSLYSGISGLRSHQTMLDVTGNNIANVNTTGFKGSATQFQDTLSQLTQGAGAPQEALGGTNPAQVGLGTQVAGIITNFSQGSAQATGRATDMMINGDGLFVTRAGTETLYTRAGAFTPDADGRLVTPDGSIVQGWPAVGGVIQQGAVGDLRMPRMGEVTANGTLESFTLGPDGTLVGAFSDGTRQPLGRIALAGFVNPAGLEKAGGSSYRTTANSGAAEIGAPGANGLGTVDAGVLEMSNVDLSQEFTNLIVAQRGFQANARIITTSDEVLQELTNLKR
ncbi:flagellar hook-basal body complex protein [Arthrobacter sp. Ld5]|uniref:flagellar hook-basal body complex protein n=1 Tax=Arthrobacter sp. Ld5 TaxID=649152 RepID=UPI003EBC1B92